MDTKQIYKIITDNEGNKAGQENISPATLINSVYDSETNISLDQILALNNHWYVPFTGDVIQTYSKLRGLVRRTGVIVTYRGANNITVTRQYKGASYNDTEWVKLENWEVYSPGSSNGSSSKPPVIEDPVTVTYTLMTGVKSIFINGVSYTESGSFTVPKGSNVQWDTVFEEGYRGYSNASGFVIADVVVTISPNAVYSSTVPGLSTGVVGLNMRFDNAGDRHDESIFDDIPIIMRVRQIGSVDEKEITLGEWFESSTGTGNSYGPKIECLAHAVLQTDPEYEFYYKGPKVTGELIISWDNHGYNEFIEATNEIHLYGKLRDIVNRFPMYTGLWEMKLILHIEQYDGTDN